MHHIGQINWAMLETIGLLAIAVSVGAIIGVVWAARDRT